MRRMPSSAKKVQSRQARPLIEGLEDRRLLSHAQVGSSLLAPTPTGRFSHHGTIFSYSTPSGGHATIHLIGLGNLGGTSVSSTGALNLVYGGTNAYSKIVSTVQGGSGFAPLASILNSQLIASGAPNSLSGVGGNVIASVYLRQFDLITGGNINLTSGVGTLVLDSVSSNSQVHLRELPPPPVTTTSTSSVASQELVSSSSESSSASLRSVNTTSTPTSGSNTSSTASSGTTLQAGQSTTITNEGVSATYNSSGNGGQTLTALTGTFTPGTNIVEPLPTGTPGQSPRPAPPGVILKINQVEGATTASTNLLTDPKIFGYDAVTGQVVRFNINLKDDVGVVDTSFTPINVPGQPATAGLNLAYDGNMLVVLVGSGSAVYAYNATTGAAVGSFKTSQPVNAIATADTVTVLGSYANNQLQTINLQQSLQTGVAQPATGNSTFTPAAGFTLLGGLAGIPGSTSLTTTLAAYFNTFQPNQLELGTQTISTASVSSHKNKLTYNLSGGTPTAVTEHGTYVPVNPTLPNASIPGSALGSVDQSTALVASASNGVNTVTTSSGALTIDYADPLVALSGTFRADLTGSALIDIQGDVQSVRGGSANGMVLNDNGNLNLVKFFSVSNSTIVGQPLGHVNIPNRSNVLILTPSRTINSSEGSFSNDGRNGVTVDPNLEPIGPLSQTGD